MDKPKTLPSLQDWLVRLIQDYEQDADACMNKGNPQVTLEKVSNANNDCFWTATAHANGLEVNWGVQGTLGNRRFFALDKCRLQSPIMELKKRMDEKLAKTYTLKSYTLI